MVARLVRDQEAMGSNPVTSTIIGDCTYWSQQERVCTRHTLFLLMTLRCLLRTELTNTCNKF